MEYHSGGSLPLLGRPRYCPGANANGGYLCETGHCCGETGCCTYYYELWWFWLLWTVLILFSCCCAYRHRRAKQRVQQQQRQRDISLLAYHGASYTSSMLDLSFLASLKLPSYEEVAAQPSTPPPPYSSVFTAPRYPQPPRTTDPHLLTQHTHQGALQHGLTHQGALQHGPLLHQPLSDGPSSLSSDNSSSCSCDSCCPSSPCSSSLSAPITYETDTSHASTPSEATPLALDVTMETIYNAAGRLELHRDCLTLERTKSASVAIDIEESLATETPKLNEVTVAVVTRSVSPLDTTSPNSKMATVDINFASEIGTLSQSLAQNTENEATTSNLSQHLEYTSLSKLNKITVVDVTGSASPLDTTSPNSNMPTVDVNFASEIGTVSQSSPTSNLSEHLEATSLLKPSNLNTDTVVVVTGYASPLDMTSPNLDTTLPVGITAPIKQQLDLKPVTSSPTSPQSPQSNMNAVLSCIQSTVASTSPTISPQDSLQRTCDTATSPQPQRTSLSLILDSNGNSCQDKNPSLIPILAPSNLNLKPSVEEETLICNSQSGTGMTSPKHNTDTNLSSPGERASTFTSTSRRLQDTLPSTNDQSASISSPVATSIHPSSILSNLLTSPSQGIQNVTKNPSEETESQGATVTMLEKASTDLSHNLSPSIATSELHKSNETIAAMVTTTTEHLGTNLPKEVVPSSLLPILKAEDMTSPSEALTLTSPQPSNFTLPQKNLIQISESQSENVTQSSRSSPNSTSESPKSAQSNLSSNLVFLSPTIPQKHELSQSPSGQILDLPTPPELQLALISCSNLSPAQSASSSFVIPSSHDLAGQEQVKELTCQANIVSSLHLSTAKSNPSSTLNPDALTQMDTSDFGTLSQSLPQKPKHVATVGVSCPTPNSSEHLEAPSLLKPSNPSLISIVSPDVLTKMATIDIASDIGTILQSLPQQPEHVDLFCPTPNSSEHLEAPSLLKPSNPPLVDSVSSLGLPTSANLNLEHPLTQLASENLPNSSSDAYSFCPAITIQADPPSFATSPASPCSIPSPPGSMLLLDPLAALNPSEKSATSSGHASSLSPSPRNTQSPPKQTLFSPCVDVFEPVNPDWEDDDDENDDDDYDDDDMGADESQYRHRRLTGDSGIEVCRCRVEDEDEEDDDGKLQKDKDGDRDGIVADKKLGMAGAELHDSVDCPVRSQKSTADEHSLCNAATETTPNSEDTGKVVIPVETV